MERKALFIINPISGGKKKDSVPGMIKQHLNHTLFEPTVMFTNGVDHARRAACEAIGKYDLVVAVGGDGTVNEVASGIVGSSVILGIIPCGSGNGLSRFLGIPMDVVEAIKLLNNGRIETIDSAEANGQSFFNIAGMGFDAHIGEIFAGGKKRGFFSYIKSSLTEIIKYRSRTYQLTIDGIDHIRKVFILSFANSSQYGNNAHIAPTASVQDGLLDVCIVKPFPLYRFPAMVWHLFAKTVDKSNFVEIIKAKDIVVKADLPGPFHLDGEPVKMESSIHIKVNPATLNIIVGDISING